MSVTLVLLEAAALRRRRLGERLAAVGAARPAAVEEQRHLARREAKVRQEAATIRPCPKASRVPTGSALRLAVASRSASKFHAIANASATTKAKTMAETKRQQIFSTHAQQRPTHVESSNSRSSYASSRSSSYARS